MEMLQTIQYIAVVQGVFLIAVLLKNKASYKKPVFWLFLGCLLSVVLFVVGDDDNNLFFEDVDMFLFDSSLFITFLFLFYRYRRSGKESFDLRDLLFFLPNLFYLGVETTELIWDREFLLLELLETITEFCFLSYLFYVLVSSLKLRSADWLSIFIVPLVVIISLNYGASVHELVTGSELELFQYEDFNSYLLLVLAFLFFMISFGLIDNPKQILPKIKNRGYNNSRLKSDQVSEYERLLLNIMEDDEIFMNQHLSIHAVSERIGIPRRYVSEVLNNHMKVSFQDFVNQYRIAAFIDRLHDPKFEHFTLFGLASDVGFSSKSTFNSAFKKATGITPIEFKSKIVPGIKTSPE